MSPDEIKNTLDNFRPRSKRTYPNMADFRSAIADYLKLSAQRAVKDPEPLATQWRRDSLSLSEIRGVTNLTSSDFGSIFESTLSGLLTEQFTDSSVDISVISRPFVMQNYLPKKISVLELGAPQLMAEDESYPKLPTVISESASPAQVRSYGAQISFSRSVFETLSGEIVEALSNYAASFSQLELGMIVELLESATLPTSASSGLDATGLGKAAAALRTQTNSAGRIGNYPLKTVVCPPALETTAWTLRRDSGMDFNVICLPGLASATTWFGVTDSARSPILRLQLRNGGAPKLYRNPNRGDIEGAEFAVSHSIGYSLAGEGRGIVQCNA